MATDLPQTLWLAYQGLWTLHQAAICSLGMKGHRGFRDEEMAGKYRLRVANVPGRLSAIDVLPGFFKSSADTRSFVAASLLEALLETVDLCEIWEWERFPSRQKRWLSEYCGGDPSLKLKELYQALQAREADRVGFSIEDVLILASMTHQLDQLRCHALCRLCPRLSRFGEVYCNEHSRSKSAPGTIADKAKRYRNGCRVAEQYHARCMKDTERLKYRPDQAHKLLAHLLWQERPGFSDRSIRAIQAFSMENDRLLKVLGHDFPRLPAQAVEPRLLERIDPYETRAGAWLLKLKYLNRWLAIAETLLHGKRKASQESVVKAANARC